MTDIFEKSVDAAYWYAQGRRLMRAKKYVHAIKAYSNAIELKREYAAAYFDRAACYYMLGRFHRVGADMDAAALLGYRDAQFWSKFEIESAGSGNTEK